MAYIGNSPANVGNYQIVDDISSSFNGSLTSFALTSGSIAITPAKSGQLLVGVNGVLQEPDDTGTNGFKVSGSNVVFSSAPESGDTFWAVYQGQNVDIGTPSNDVVDTVHIKDNAITSAKIAAGAIVASDVADDSVTTAKIADDAVTADKLANSINTEIAANTAKTGITTSQANAITANTAKVTNATHSGEVTGATALTIADNVVDEANLKVSNTPTNGYFLSAQSGNTGGMTWAEVDALPSQSGNSGKYLTTDGSAASWAVLDTDANTTTKGLYEHAHTIAANYSITSGNNAMTAGPITINSSVSVTIPSGSTWVIAQEIHMAKVKIQGHASGTGVLTVTAPNTSTDRTITLPDGTGTLIADNGSGNVGIGTSSPSAVLETKNTTDGSTFAFQATNDNDHEIVQIGAQADGDGYLTVHGQGASTNIKVLLHSDAESHISGGDLKIGSGDIYFGTAGKGIVLGSTSNTDANTLDDYEEGTWTPQISLNDSTTVGGLTNGPDKEGVYTKIGNLVTVHFIAVITAVGTTTGSAIVKLEGLPFTIANVLTNTSLDSGSGSISYYSGTAGIHGMTVVCIGGGTTAWFYRRSSSDGDLAGRMDKDDITNSFNIRGTMTYQA